MSTTPHTDRVDFQQLLNDFEASLMASDKLKKHRMGLTIQRAGEKQDELAPTRGGNPYLHGSDRLMNAYCRVVIADPDRRRRCDELETKMEQRMQGEGCDALYCCCHQGVSNVLYKFQYKADGVKDDKSREQKEFEKDPWFIFLGQFLATAPPPDPGDGQKMVSIEFPEATENPYIRAPQDYDENSARIFRHPDTFRSLDSDYKRLIASNYFDGDMEKVDAAIKAGVMSPTAGTDEEYGIRTVSSDDIHAAWDFVRREFSDFISNGCREAEGSPDLSRPSSLSFSVLPTAFHSAFLRFKNEQSLTQVIELIAKTSNYLRSFQHLAPLEEKKSPLGRIHSLLDVLRDALDTCRSHGAYPSGKVMQDIHKQLTDFDRNERLTRSYNKRKGTNSDKECEAIKRPRMWDLDRWRLDLLQVTKALQDDLDALPSDKKNTAMQRAVIRIGNRRESIIAADGKGKERSRLSNENADRLSKLALCKGCWLVRGFARFLFRHRWALKAAMALSWLLFTSGLVYAWIEADFGGPNFIDVNFVACLATSLFAGTLGCALDYLLGRLPEPSENFYESTSNEGREPEAALRRRTMADLFSRHRWVTPIAICFVAFTLTAITTCVLGITSRINDNSTKSSQEPPKVLDDQPANDAGAPNVQKP